MLNPVLQPIDNRTATLVSRLWRLWIKPYRTQIIGVFALMILAAVTTTAYPLVIQWTFKLIDQKDTQTIYLIPILIIAVTSCRAATLYFQAISTSAMVNQIVLDIQNALYRHLLGSDLARLQRDAAGTLTSRFTADVEALRMAINRCLTGIVRDGLTVVALLGTILYIDPLLTVIVLVVYPVMGYPIIQIGKRIRKTAGSLQAGIGDLTAFLQQSFLGVRMIKSYRLESDEAHRADGAFKTLYTALMKASRLRARVDPLLEVASGFAVAGVLAFGTWRVASGTGTVGDFTGFVTALLMAAQPVRSLGNLNAVMQEGLAAAQRVFEIMDEQPQITQRPSAIPLAIKQGRVELKSVVFAYKPERPVLQNLNLVAEAGQTVALVGRSGGGKSTIFNMLTRLYDVQGGQVLIDGQDVRDVTIPSLRDAVTLVSQDVIVFNESAAANIGYGRKGAPMEDIQAAAQAAEAHEFITKLPMGYDTVVGEQGSSLSGGQKQRLVLARAFLRNSPILLLDEATSALDAASEEMVQHAIKRLAQGRTTFIIAHRLSTVRQADVIYVIDKGQVIEQGKHDELLAKNGAYAELYRLQFKA
ncbi:MAG: ABC transporter ATP-binding protein [Alphaproteobacteria bacterium]|nr:ABC transporter ATP-binding protein [Alphaproteobacteria bacterium]